MINKTDKIVITGGKGFVGSHLTEELINKNYTNVIALDSIDYDLTDMGDVYRMFLELQPDLVIHLAATVGGIGFNQENPGLLFYNNLIMGMNLLQCERGLKKRLKKFVCLGTVCSFPKITPVPFEEKDLWEGYPEETNAPYGIAKKSLLVMLQAYRKQYGTNGIYLMPTNLFGERDCFDPEKSHVIPALIKKVYDSHQNGTGIISVWGDGSATREFLYVKECVRGIRLAMENYDEAEPINLGTGKEISIKALVSRINILYIKNGYSHTSIVFDKYKPNGQPRRCLDIRKAAEKFGFYANSSNDIFDEQLENTIKWYIKEQNKKEK